MLGTDMKICREKPNVIKIQQQISVTLRGHLIKFYFCRLHMIATKYFA